MPAKLKLIDSDAHVIEPPNLWADYTEKKYLAKAPRVVSDNGSDRWLCEGVKMHSTRELVGVTRDFTDRRQTGKYGTDIVKSGYLPGERLKDMAKDGVWAEVVYPTVALRLFMLKDASLKAALFRAYNSWIADFCKAHPNRLKGLGCLAMEDVAGAVKELERCKKLGLIGGLIILEGMQHEDARYHPLWKASRDLDMPISMHVETGNVMSTNTRVDLITYATHIQKALASMVYSGLFDRFPKFKLVSVESDAGWAGYFIERMDFFYNLHGSRRKERGIMCARPPSEIFHDSIYYTFITDLSGVAARKIVGVNNILWSSDFPHSGSTWPHSQASAAKHVAGVPKADADKILWKNTARLYGFSMS